MVRLTAQKSVVEANSKLMTQDRQATERMEHWNTHSKLAVKMQPEVSHRCDKFFFLKILSPPGCLWNILEQQSQCGAPAGGVQSMSLLPVRFQSFQRDMLMRFAGSVHVPTETQGHPGSNAVSSVSIDFI